MEYYDKKFLKLLRYVAYIWDENVKVQCFLSGLPSFYGDIIEFYELKTLEEMIHKDKYVYDQNKHITDF